MAEDTFTNSSGRSLSCLECAAREKKLIHELAQIQIVQIFLLIICNVSWLQCVYVFFAWVMHNMCYANIM